MISEYKCDACGSKLSTDIDTHSAPCIWCDGQMVLVFCKKWVGGVDGGHEELFEIGKPIKINGV